LLTVEIINLKERKFSLERCSNKEEREREFDNLKCEGVLKTSRIKNT